MELGGGGDDDDDDDDDDDNDDDDENETGFEPLQTFRATHEGLCSIFSLSSLDDRFGALWTSHQGSETAI